MISPKERVAQRVLSIYRNQQTGAHGAFVGASRASKVPRNHPKENQEDMERGSHMSGKRPRYHVPLVRVATKGRKQQAETLAETSQHQVKETITVAINANLLKCCVCFGPLTPPLFQCTKGHVSCSGCCTEGYEDDKAECLMCREPETATRCRAMEHILAGLRVPCPFREHGCAEMIPYTSEQAHKASCTHGPRHCPIFDCVGYAGKPLREHVQQDHADVVCTVISPGYLTPLRMGAHEQARVLMLGDAEFLVIVGQYKQLGRALSVVRLVNESVYKQDFKHRIEVVGKAGVLSLSGETLDAERLSEPYKASPFLFVPNETWDSPEGINVFIELK